MNQSIIFFPFFQQLKAEDEEEEEAMEDEFDDEIGKEKY